ncbi:hypothetical protein AK88_00606 [Plasmodium fragile]|uniref:Uncharacterized protein n=1 Tax=Plasmodium fragile TaxID=5857 RepID=A0A0D9QRV4_PLAFR|nr:uncharacterized protein AK88_00606 [Plasmodium fragile]KJP89648.1 hypothetical protein AK88_00606 [Plasmodium fragile]
MYVYYLIINISQYEKPEDEKKNLIFLLFPYFIYNSNFAVAHCAKFFMLLLCSVSGFFIFIKTNYEFVGGSFNNCIKTAKGCMNVLSVDNCSSKIMCLFKWIIQDFCSHFKISIYSYWCKTILLSK